MRPCAAPSAGCKGRSSRPGGRVGVPIGDDWTGTGSRSSAAPPAPSVARAHQTLVGKHTRTFLRLRSSLCEYVPDALTAYAETGSLTEPAGGAPAIYQRGAMAADTRDERGTPVLLITPSRREATDAVVWSLAHDPHAPGPAREITAALLDDWHIGHQAARRVLLRFPTPGQTGKMMAQSADFVARAEFDRQHGDLFPRAPMTKARSSRIRDCGASCKLSLRIRPLARKSVQGIAEWRSHSVDSDVSRHEWRFRVVSIRQSEGSGPCHEVRYRQSYRSSSENCPSRRRCPCKCSNQRCPARRLLRVRGRDPYTPCDDFDLRRQIPGTFDGFARKCFTEEQ